VICLAGHLRMLGIANRNGSLGHGTVIVMGMPSPAMSVGRTIWVIRHVALICLEVRARALPILPHGL
jgi:hypothetical protein